MCTQITSKEFISLCQKLGIIFPTTQTFRIDKTSLTVTDAQPQARYARRGQIPYLTYKKNLAKYNVNDNTFFCEFNLPPDLICTEGVYFWVVNDAIMYIGEGKSISKRFRGYRKISPCMCYRNGQSTNVKMNQFVLECINNGLSIDIYICDTANIKTNDSSRSNHEFVEHELLNCISTPLNTQR